MNLRVEKEGDKKMGKELEKITEAAEKSTDKLINTFVERVVDRVDQIEPTVEKGKKTLEKMATITADAIGSVIDAAADHYAGIVNGEGVDLEKEKERAKDTIGTLVEKAGEYIETVAESVSSGIAQAEEHIEKDIEAAKEVKEKLIQNKNYSADFS